MREKKEVGLQVQTLTNNNKHLQMWRLSLPKWADNSMFCTLVATMRKLAAMLWRHCKL
jgi:hypothetical protein